MVQAIHWWIIGPKPKIPIKQDKHKTKQKQEKQIYGKYKHPSPLRSQRHQSVHDVPGALPPSARREWRFFFIFFFIIFFYLIRHFFAGDVCWKYFFSFLLLSACGVCVACAPYGWPPASVLCIYKIWRHKPFRYTRPFRPAPPWMISSMRPLMVSKDVWRRVGRRRRRRIKKKNYI